MMPTLPFDVGSARSVVGRALHVADALVVGHAAGFHRGGRGVGRLGARRVAVVEVRADRVVAVYGERARDLLRRPVVAGHVVDHHDARVRAGRCRPREVRLDLVTVVSRDRDGLGRHRGVGHGPSCYAPRRAYPRRDLGHEPLRRLRGAEVGELEHEPVDTARRPRRRARRRPRRPCPRPRRPTSRSASAPGRSTSSRDDASGARPTGCWVEMRALPASGRSSSMRSSA